MKFDWRSFECASAAVGTLLDVSVNG